MRSRLDHRRRRQRFARWALALWFLGVEILPGLHLSLHDHLAAHDHEDGQAAAAGQLVVTVHTDGAHSHGGVEHRHGVAADPVRAPDGRVAIAPPPPPPRDHGAHSLAHRALAIAPAAPPIVHPLPVDRRPMAVDTPAALQVADATVPAAAARGPPV